MSTQPSPARGAAGTTTTHGYPSVAGVMEIAFIVGVLVAYAHRGSRSSPLAVLDLGAAASASLIPLLMVNAPDYDGLFQRGMFLVAYTWYITQGVSTLHGEWRVR